VRLHAIESARHIIRIRRVAAHKSMRPELPHIAGLRDRYSRRLGHLVGIDEPLVARQTRNLVRIKCRQAQVDVETGNRIRYGDALWSGLATHTIKAEDQAGFLDRLAATGDPESVLRGFFISARRETDRPTLAAIAQHFAQASLRDIIDSLERAAAADEFAAKTLATIRSRSPTSLNVAWRQISAGLTLSMEACMKMEFRILNRMLAGHDFYEGIRAAIIDKGSKPQWRPANLGAVSEADVDAYFASLGDRELDL